MVEHAPTDFTGRIAPVFHRLYKYVPIDIRDRLLQTIFRSYIVLFSWFSKVFKNRTDGVGLSGLISLFTPSSSIFCRL